MIRFDATEEELSVTDVVEETHYRLDTGPIAPTPTPADALPTPVDAAVTVSVSHLRLPTVVDCFLRDADGGFRHAVTDRETEIDRKSTRLNSSHVVTSRMPSSA